MKTSKWAVLHWLRRPAMQLGRAFGRLGDRHLLAAMAVLVTAVNDNLVEGSPPIGPITHSATTVDRNDNGTAINSLTAYVTNNETSKEPVLYLTLKDATTLPGSLAVENEDIVAFTGSDFSILFDGSDVGLAKASLDAFAVIAPNEILLSFRAPETIPGITETVQDSDIVKFTATQLGSTTSGTFELFFRGSDAGLSPIQEDIDALDLLDDGRLIVSTVDSFTATGVSGDDEDLIAFTPDKPGDYSSGTWAMYFDGSDVELADADVYAVGVDARGNIHLSTTSAFAVTGISGEDEDVFTFVPSQLGAETAGTYASKLLFDGSQFGLAANDVIAIDIPIPEAL